MEYVSIHYGCPKCKQDAAKPNIIHSTVPPSLLGSYAFPPTVAWVIYQKYINGLSLYRQEKDRIQYGFALSRTTMANWVIACTITYLKVMYDYCHRLLQREFAMADEMPVQVLKEEGEKRQPNLICSCSKAVKMGHHPIILYHYAPTRSGNTAKDFLNAFRGYLMVDSYTRYNKVKDIKCCCCFTHIQGAGD